MFTAASKYAQAILDIARRGIELPGRNGANVGFVFFVPEPIIIQFGADGLELKQYAPPPFRVRGYEILSIYEHRGGIFPADDMARPEDPAEGAVQAADLGVVHVGVIRENVEPCEAIGCGRVAEQMYSRSVLYLLI